MVSIQKNQKTVEVTRIAKHPCAPDEFEVTIVDADNLRTTWRTFGSLFDGEESLAERIIQNL